MTIHDSGWVPAGYTSDGGVALVAPEGSEAPVIPERRGPLWGDEIERNIVPGDDRHATAGHLTYGPGVDMLDPYRVVGPNTLGEYVWPATIQRAEGKTRIGFAHLPPAVVAQQLGAIQGRKRGHKGRRKA